MQVEYLQNFAHVAEATATIQSCQLIILHRIKLIGRIEKKLGKKLKYLQQKCFFSLDHASRVHSGRNIFESALADVIHGLRAFCGLKKKIRLG